MMAYSDEQKAVALAALEANRGDVEKTARFCKIPARTIRHWQAGDYIKPEVAQNAEEKKVSLADALETLADKIVLHCTKELDEASFKDGMIGLGIAVEKMQLLRNKPTEITNDYSALTDDEIDRRIADAQDRTPAPPGSVGPA